MSVFREPPKGWGEDELSRVLDQASGNTLYFFERYPTEWGKRVALDGVLLAICTDPPTGIEAFMFSQAHSAFRAAVRLITSGQVVEGIMVLRGCLEMALYGAYMHDNGERALVWVRREDGEDEKKAAKNLFKIGTIFEDLEKRDASLCAKARELYDRTIDHGAHPNEMALTSRMRLEAGGTFAIGHIVDADSHFLSFGALFASAVAFTCLQLYERLHPDRSALLGISERLPELRAGL